MAFLEFLRRVYDIETQYTGGQDSAPPGGLSGLLGQMQAGVDGGRPARMGGPMLGGGPGGPIDLAGPPDGGDLYDYHNSNGDPGLLGLFGSPDPVPLRRPPAGVDRRKGF